MTNEGISVIDRMNSEKIVADNKIDIPFIVLTNGRTDGSMPWINNPSFYKQLNASKKGFAVFWNNGGHDMSATAPKDIMEYYQRHSPIYLTTSYPAFSDFSANKNPGNGEKEDGDIEGWMNRGLYWSPITETENSWSTTIWVADVPATFPATVTLTPRKAQQFKIGKNEKLMATVEGKKIEVSANEKGVVSLENIVIPVANTKINISFTKR